MIFSWLVTLIIAYSHLISANLIGQWQRINYRPSSANDAPSSVATTQYWLGGYIPSTAEYLVYGVSPNSNFLYSINMTTLNSTLLSANATSLSSSSRVSTVDTETGAFYVYYTFTGTFQHFFL
jgi:hypothetical protein